MTLSKAAMTISSVALALLFGGGVYVLMNMNTLGKGYIERAATETLGVKVNIGSLDISLKEKKAHATDVVIANPEGFEKPYAVKVPNINIALGPLAGGLVTIEDIDVNGTEVNLEVHKNITNIAAIQNRMNRGSASAENVQKPLKVIIDKLAISQAQIKPSVVLFAQQDIAPVQVPDIVMVGIGRKENGAPVNQAIAQIWAHIAQRFNMQASHAGLLEGMNPEALSAMGVSTLDRFRENLRDVVKEKADTVSEGIDKLFNE